MTDPFALFALVQRLDAAGVTVRVVDGKVQFAPASTVQPEDVAALRLFKAEILEVAQHTDDVHAAILERRGWLVHRLTSCIYVAPGARYPGVNDPPALDVWLTSLVERRVWLSEAAPNGAVALSPLSALSGADVVAAGQYGALVLASVVPAARLYAPPLSIREISHNTTQPRPTRAPQPPTRAPAQAQHDGAPF
jgi:hypothetical protein